MGDIERPYVTSYSGRGTPYATRYALPMLDRDRWTSYQEKEEFYRERRNGSVIREDRVKDTRKCLYIGIILLTVTLIVVITTLAVFVTMYALTSEKVCLDDSSKVDLHATQEIQRILTTSSDNVESPDPETTLEEVWDFHREKRSDLNNADRIKRKRKCLYIGIMLLAIMLIVLVTAVVYLAKMNGWNTEKKVTDDILSCPPKH